MPEQEQIWHVDKNDNPIASDGLQLAITHYYGE